MDSNFEKLEVLAKYDVEQYDDLHNTQSIMRDINEKTKTIAVQREIIAEQAVQIQALQEKLKKYGWNT